MLQVFYLLVASSLLGPNTLHTNLPQQQSCGPCRRNWGLGICVKSNVKAKDRQSLQTGREVPVSVQSSSFHQTSATTQGEAIGFLHPSFQFLHVVCNYNIYSYYHIYQITKLCRNFKLQILGPTLIT